MIFAFIMATVATISGLYAQFAPEARIRTLDWARRQIYNESGKPYSHPDYPHLGAPGGPCDANDDPQVNVIVEQFATRLGKTFFGQVMQLKAADAAPAPMMFVSSVEKLAGEIVARTYGMLEKAPILKDQLLPERLRKRDCISLDNCKVYVGWARSVNTLADKNIKYGHGNEIDKWERLSTSKEADPLDLFMDRAKDFPNFKYVLESTPTVEGESRVERMLLRSSNSRYYVPCPHCKKYQTLNFQKIEWDKLQGGKHDLDLALNTARYICDYCNERCMDHHRTWMMRYGVWVPEGCGVDHEAAMDCATERSRLIAEETFSHTLAGRFWKHGYTTGVPTRDNNYAGYQLSSLYALKLTWGRIAAEWVSVHESPNRRRNFVNSWLAETWRLETRTEEWESLSRRIISSVEEFVAPAWASLVTVGIDRQVGFYKYVVRAWGPGETSHTMTYGQNVSLDEIIQKFVRGKYDHADGGKIDVMFTLCDSGYDPKEPYTASRDALDANPPLPLLCCKGSSKPLQTPYKIGELGEKTMMPGLPLVMVDGDWTQTELEEQLRRRPGELGCVSLYAGTKDHHQNHLREILNECPEYGLDRNNHNVVTWRRATDKHPNDDRDCMRYAYIAMLIATGGQPIPTREEMLASLSAPPAVTSRPTLTHPDGRAYVATNN